ncbi:MAG: DUF2922 family protein [Synergistaceae bacterium]|nr:DUF2922 family protein [Synergistaceae bacterium]
MSAKLVLTFADASGNDVKMSYSHADSEAEASDVRTAIQAIITNGSIFTAVPVSAKSAKLVITTESNIELSE